MGLPVRQGIELVGWREGMEKRFKQTNEIYIYILEKGVHDMGGWQV